MINNKPYNNIERFVNSDLREYDQHNPCPISKTIIVDNKGSFRHYELGPIIGYVLFGEINDGKIKTFISQIEEDDEYWFAPSAPMYMSGAWINSVKKTFDRMKEWYDEHIFEGFVDGQWQNKVIKEITNEEIFRKDGLSASPVLEGPQ